MDEVSALVVKIVSVATLGVVAFCVILCSRNIRPDDDTIFFTLDSLLSRRIVGSHVVAISYSLTEGTLAQTLPLMQHSLSLYTFRQPACFCLDFVRPREDTYGFVLGG